MAPGNLPGRDLVLEIIGDARKPRPREAGALRIGASSPAGAGAGHNVAITTKMKAREAAARRCRPTMECDNLVSARSGQQSPDFNG